MAANWLIGEVARLRLEVININDQAADPSALRLKVKTPAGAVAIYAWPTSPEVVRTGVGNFYADIPLLEAGVYAFRFESDSPLMGASERSLTVKKSLFA